MIHSESFGTINGREVILYTLSDESGSAKVMNFGATITSIIVPDKNGQPVDVVLGYDTAQQYYETAGKYFGATIGRYANRIKHGFPLGGCYYRLPLNDGENCLHGGPGGFDKRFFESEIVGDEVVMGIKSANGEEGFPGEFSLTVRYRFASGRLSVAYSYSSSADTAACITNHSYFNLNGKGDILKHLLTINADSFCELDSGLIPVLPIKSVQGTAFDFRAPSEIGGASSTQFAYTKYYDHPFLLNGGAVAEAVGDTSGIHMTVLSDMPAVQFYAGCYVGEQTGRGGNAYHDYSGFCLEPEFLPDSPNNLYHRAAFIEANEVRNYLIEYVFSV